MTILFITATMAAIALLAGFGFCVDLSSEMAASRVTGLERRDLGEDIMG